MKYSSLAQSKQSKFQMIFRIILLITMMALIMLYYPVSFGQSWASVPIDCPYAPPTDSPVPLNRASLKAHLQDELILLGSMPTLKLTKDADMDVFGWRQTSNIIYLLGRYDIADSFILVNSSCPNLCISIFLPELAQREIVFNGDVPNMELIKEKFKVDLVSSIGKLPDFVGSASLVSPDSSILELLPSKIRSKLESAGSSVSYRSEIEQAFISSRFIKNEKELEYLRFAGLAAAFSHQMVGHAIETWDQISESTLAAYFTYLSTVCKNRLQAYPPIVGAGPHAGILHFPTGQTWDAGYGPIGSEDFILIDASGAYDGYASDLTRTYIKTPSAKYIELEGIVLNSQLAGLAAHVKGNTWSGVVNASLETLTEGLWKHDFLIADNLETLVQSGVISIFMPHGVGHPVGLEVHDPYPKSTGIHLNTVQGLRNEYPLNLKNDFVLKEGHVNTVEPGVYFIPYLLDQAKNNKTLGVAHLINWEKVEEWKEVGGIRIEDVIAIDWSGNPVILTAKK